MKYWLLELVDSLLLVLAANVSEAIEKAANLKGILYADIVSVQQIEVIE